MVNTQMPRLKGIQAALFSAGIFFIVAPFLTVRSIELTFESFFLGLVFTPAAYFYQIPVIGQLFECPFFCNPTGLTGWLVIILLWFALFSGLGALLHVLYKKYRTIFSLEWGFWAVGLYSVAIVCISIFADPKSILNFKILYAVPYLATVISHPTTSPDIALDLSLTLLGFLGPYLTFLTIFVLGGLSKNLQQTRS